jgi:SAM-dependent methyltransferase
MANTPTEQSQSAGNKLHQYRGAAESFGVDPARYDRARAPYPDALVNRVVADSPGADVLDVGCGTGIEARQFQAAGATVLGVEPDVRMAEFARQRGLEVEVATFEIWEPSGRTFDAVVAGQSWHWVDPVAGPTKAAQVLRPGGRLALFAHVFESPPEVEEASAAAFRKLAPDSPFNAKSTRKDQPARSMLDMYQAMFTKFADGIREADAFDEPEQWRFDWERTYTRDEWLDFLPTTGRLTQLPADKVEQVLAAVGAAVDAIGGSFTMSYTTLAVTATRSIASRDSRQVG